MRGVGAGGVISTCYCLMYKLHEMHISRRQLEFLLNHRDSPYIRGVGFLYIRYMIYYSFHFFASISDEYYRPVLSSPNLRKELSFLIFKITEITALINWQSLYLDFFLLIGTPRLQQISGNGLNHTSKMMRFAWFEFFKLNILIYCSFYSLFFEDDRCEGGRRM